MSSPDVIEQVDIAASPADVWCAVSDPTAYGRWSPEATGAVRRTGAGAFAVGDRFTGRNRLALPWTTRCRVVAAQIEQRFAFDVAFGPVPIARWSYELVPLPEGGTRVTERWTDRREGILGAVVRPAGLLVGRGYDAAERNRATMRETLSNLKADLER
jgi:hypothetical protein